MVWNSCEQPWCLHQLHDIAYCQTTTRPTSLQYLSFSSAGMSTSLLSNTPLKGMIGSPPWFFTHSNTFTGKSDNYFTMQNVWLIDDTWLWDMPYQVCHASTSCWNHCWNHCSCRNYWSVSHSLAVIFHALSVMRHCLSSRMNAHGYWDSTHVSQRMTMQCPVATTHEQVVVNWWCAYQLPLVATCSSFWCICPHSGWWGTPQASHWCMGCCSASLSPSHSSHQICTVSSQIQASLVPCKTCALIQQSKQLKQACRAPVSSACYT